MNDTVFIAWVKYSARALDIAAAFQPPMDLWNIEATRLKPFGFLLPLRYAVQAYRTWNRLCFEKPRAIFVQSPPVFAPLIVAAYASRTGARWIMDMHSSPFNSRKWRWSLPLHRWLARRATATLVHGPQILSRTHDWEGIVLDSAEPPPAIAFDAKAPRDERFRVQVICSFASDEPVDVVLDAARQLPDVTFHITGDVRRAPAKLLAAKPDNVSFTGFLSRRDYFAEMASAHAVMVLTLRPDAMQMGAWEAMFVGQPVILSDHPHLRDYYQQGAIFVSNTPESIADGIRRMQVEENLRRKEMLIMAEQKQQLWERHRIELAGLIGLPATTLNHAINNEAKTCL